ncbi:MAG: MerR family transcriptional regulator [Pacificimonas sp.]|nr:MerR family transcriptional regulator [Pacificimonas sp.]
MVKSADAYRTISEVSEDVGVPQHVLRFWETKFAQVKPMKRGGGRRYYRRQDVDLIRAINRLLYTDGLTIKGVQKLLRERGVKAVSEGSAEIVPTSSEPVLGADANAEPVQPAEAQDANGPQDAALSAPLVDLAALKGIRDRLATALQAARP